MVSFYISRSGKTAVDALAEKLGQSKADTYRQLLSVGLRQADRRTRPSPPKPSKETSK